MSGNLRYVPVWRKNDPKAEADAIAMWRDMGVLPPAVKPEQRAKELVALAYQGERLVGITTADLQVYPLLRQRFAFMRILMRPEAEAAGIGVPLTLQMQDILRQWSRANPQEQVAGCGALVSSNVYGHAPVLPTGLALVGYAEGGFQVRVLWWDHFRIPLS